MNIPYSIIIDLANNSRKQTVDVKQADRSTRILKFTLLNKNKPFDMSDVYTATVKGVKKDGSTIFADGEIIKDEEGNKTNVVVYTMSDHVTAASGEIVFEIELLSDKGEIVTGFNFYVDVINQLYDPDDIISESDLSGFRSYLVRTLNAALATERTKDAFEDVYGTVATIKEDLEKEIEECQSFLEYLQTLLDTGAFIGPRGPQGENGANGVIVETPQIIGFDIVDDELVCHYVGSEAPDIEINDDGDLEWTF